MHDPFVHASSAHLCPNCGMPDLPGVSCLCDEICAGELSCSTCGSGPGDYEASCPECRAIGRVDMSLVSFIDRVLAQPLPAPPDELRAEEPLPTSSGRRQSWRPAAA